MAHPPISILQLRGIRTDGHLDSLQLDRIVPYLYPDHPLTPKPTTEAALEETPPAPSEPMQVDPARIAASAAVDAPDPPSDAHVHSDLYDEEPFEEEHVELGIEAVPDESPTHIHFAVEESADMRFFARSNSMPPVSSLPPLEMSSLLASQAIPYSPQSHYLTEGLDLAASNRTPIVSTFEAAWALTRPSLITSGYDTTGMMPKSYDAQAIIAQSQFGGGGSSPLTPPPPEPRGTRDPSEVDGAGQISETSAHHWGFASLNGQPGAYRGTSSAQRAHSVPQSPFPTQHFGSIPHVTGPVSAVGDFVTARGSEFSVASPYAVESSMRVDSSLPRHDTYLAANGVQGRGMNGMLHVRDPLDVDVDVDVSNLLNTEMEEDENGVRQVTVVQIDTSTGEQEDKTAKPTCHHVAEVSGTLSDLNALGKFSNMTLIGLFPPLTRALEVLLAVATCDRCGVASDTTIPHLALLSRTCEVLRHPHPLTPSPLPLVIAGGSTMRTGLAPEIEVHIVDIVWATWRGSSIQKICAAFDKRASDTLEEIAANRSKAVPTPVKTTETDIDELDDEEEEFAVVEEDEPGQKQESEPTPGEKMFVERESNGIIWREEKKEQKDDEVVQSSIKVDCIPEIQPGEIRARLFRRAVKILLGVLSK